MIKPHVVLYVLGLLLLVPVLVLFSQVVLASFGKKRSLPYQRVASRVAVLVPAHNESAVIASSLASLLPQLQAGDRVLVVADNCTDNTAAIARAAGAEVVERHDATQRGKGYALAFGLRYLQCDPPDILVILDADCKVGERSLSALVSACTAEQRPIQALNLMKAPAGAGLKLRIAEFAWLVRNLVRPLGWSRLDLPCQLMGTGMALPWALASYVAKANDSLVEDMKVGIDLARTGYPPQLCLTAEVTSCFPSGEQAVQTQRTRWEHGHLGMILAEGPGLLRQSLMEKDIRLLGLALDLVVPPLALLLAMVSGFLATCALWATVTGTAGPLFLALFLGTIFGLAVLLAWARWGRRTLSFAELMGIPRYVLSKLPLYLAFLVRRQKEWVRTGRD